jgi:hypothetical protein
MKKNPITRRDFLKKAAGLPLAGALIPAILEGKEENKGQAAQKIRVVLIRNKDVLDDRGKPRYEVIESMMDEAICALFGAANPQEAWRRIIKAEDVVGIKTNVWSYLPTPRELEEYLKRRVMECGVAEKNIAITDRGVLNNPIFKKATALINARPGRTHHWSGMGTCIKNYIQFVARPYEWHADSCADLGKIWFLPEVKGKTRLNILVMLTPLFHGIGPHHFSRQYTWPYCGLILSQDPVAADSTGLRILQAKRKGYFGEERPLQPTPHHIFLAETRHGLGVASPEKIDLIKLGWQDGILI